MLSTSLRRELKAKAHSLKPVVIIGQRGVTDSVVASIAEALDAHELIKIRLPSGDRQQQPALIEQNASSLGADAVGAIGRVAILYRKALK